MNLFPDDDARATAAGRQWLPWAFALTSCTTVILAAVVVWMAGRVARAPGGSDSTEPNIPLVALQPLRAGVAPATAVVPAGAQHLVLWIDLGPSTYRRFRLELFAADDTSIISIDRLEPGQYGAITASIPAGKLPAGDVRITLTGQEPSPAALVGEYQMRVERR